MNDWTIHQRMVLTKSEIASVLSELNRKSRRSINTQMNLIIFRLSTCCGLRVSEICSLRLRDVHLGIKHPYIYIRKEVAKNKRARKIPLWWDAGTLGDISNWKEVRSVQGAKADDSFVCAQSRSAYGKPLSRVNARNRYISSLKVLGKERQAELSIHNGRHTYISHSLKVHSPQSVRDAAGHSSLNTTSLYAHVLIDDHEEIGNLFG